MISVFLGPLGKTTAAGTMRHYAKAYRELNQQGEVCPKTTSQLSDSGMKTTTVQLDG